MHLLYTDLVINRKQIRYEPEKWAKLNLFWLGSKAKPATMTHVSLSTLKTRKIPRSKSWTYICSKSFIWGTNFRVKEEGRGYSLAG